MTKLGWLIRNRSNARRIRRDLVYGRQPIADISRYERKIYSQNGEDGIVEAIFAVIGTTTRSCVEFGVGNGQQCNTAYLVRHKGWTGLWMDPRAAPAATHVRVHHEFITAQNVNAVFKKHGVPDAFDLLSIDIDGNDYWVWKAITGYRPRVVVIEYNASIPPTESRAIAYDPSFQWTQTDYHGASLLALHTLGREKGYTLVGCDSSGTNAFFVYEGLIEGRFAPQEVSRLYRPPAWGDGQGHPHDPHRIMMRV